jgi:hypothetical protein
LSNLADIEMGHEHPGRPLTSQLIRRFDITLRATTDEKCQFGDIPDIYSITSSARPMSAVGR